MKTLLCILSFFALLMSFLPLGPSARSWATGSLAGTVVIDSDERLVENSVIRIKWDLQNPEFVREFVFKPLDPNLNLTRYWLGSGSGDDEFTGNSWSIGDPQGTGVVVVGRGQVGTWAADTDASGTAVVTINSVGTRGYPVTTVYRIEADSPVIQVQRLFRFSVLTLPAVQGFRPYIFRLDHAIGFGEYALPLSDGPMVTGTAISCPSGCQRTDWAGTWADLRAPTLGFNGAGLVLRSTDGPRSGIWIDYDLYSDSVYVAATPFDGTDVLDHDVTVSCLFGVHLGPYWADLSPALYLPIAMRRH